MPPQGSRDLKTSLVRDTLKVMSTKLTILNRAQGCLSGKGIHFLWMRSPRTEIPEIGRMRELIP